MPGAAAPSPRLAGGLHEGEVLQGHRMISLVEEANADVSSRG